MRVPSGEINGALPVAPSREAPVELSLAIISRELLDDWYTIVALAVDVSASSATMGHMVWHSDASVHCPSTAHEISGVSTKVA